MDEEYNFNVPHDLVERIAPAIGLIIIHFTFIEQFLSGIAELTAEPRRLANKVVTRTTSCPTKSNTHERPLPISNS